MKLNYLGGSKKSNTNGNFVCTLKGIDLTNIGIGILFGASGKFEDDWIINEITLNITLTKNK